MRFCFSLYSYLWLSFSLLLFGTGCASLDPKELGFTPHQLHVVNPHAQYAKVLPSCVKKINCNLHTLPFLGQETPQPTISDILNRTLFQNEEVKQQFEEILHLLPKEDLLLFRSVRIIVLTEKEKTSLDGHLIDAIGTLHIELIKHLSFPDNIDETEKPKFFYFENQALDPARASYLLAQVYQENAQVKQFLRLTSIQIAFLKLLYHELAHAQDFFPPSLLAHYDRNKPPLELSQKHSIGENDPLVSEKLHSLFFHKKDLSAEEIMDEFAQDHAVSLYGYKDVFEDAAEFFSDLMLLHRFGIEHSFVILKPNAQQNSNQQTFRFKLVWGEENRILNPKLWEKAKTIGQAFAPYIPWADLFPSFSAKSKLVEKAYLTVKSPSLIDSSK